MAKGEAPKFVPVQIDYVAVVSVAAILVGYEGRELWVPKSQLHASDLPVERSGEPVEIHVQEWFAKKEGLR